MQNTSVADFYICSVQADRASAEAIGNHLRSSGYTVVNGWELLGKSWSMLLYQMQDARALAKRVVVVLSADFLREHPSADSVWWLASQHQSPFVEAESLIGVKVAPVGQPLSGHFSSPSVPLIDLTNVPLHTPGAVQALLAGVRHPGAPQQAGAGVTYVLSTGGGSGVPPAAGGVDYYISCVPADRPRADVQALYLSRAGVRVFRLWADMGSLSQAELEQRVSEAPAMIAVLSDNYMDDPPWEWMAFGAWGSTGGMWQSNTRGRTLVLLEIQDMQMGKINSPGARVVVIPLHDMGSRPEQDERDLLVGLRLPAPVATAAATTSSAAVPAALAAALASPSPQGQTFCSHCGAANPTGAAQCFACQSSLVAGAPATVSSGAATAPATNTQAGATTYCDSCGEPNRSSALYCRVCGKPMSGPVTSAGATGLLAAQQVLKRRYLVLASVGKGGFGAVYKVADTRFGNRLLAVKEMSQAGLTPAQVSEAAEDFKREALLLAGLMNPHLPRIYDHFSEGGRWYLAMDFIEGQTLEEYLGGVLAARGQIPVEEVLDMGRQLCDVLWYLHHRRTPIIFRDLKPANIMRTQDGHLYLIDFGIARHFKPGQAKDTAALGSTGYAAPEQYGKAQTTPRADLYALGATLHQLSTGDDPSETPFQFRPLSLTGRRFPSGLDVLLKMMVETDSSLRPQSALIVKQALQSIAAGQGFPQLAQQAGQVQAPVAAPAAKGDALCVYREHGGRVRAASLSPDGQQVASVGDNSRLRIWEALSGRTLHDLQAHSPLRVVAWSPDGSPILTGGVGMSFKAWNPATGMNTPLPYIQPGVGNTITALAWSGSGKKFVLVTDLGVVIVGSTYGIVGIDDYFYGNRSVSLGGLEGGVAAFSPDETLVASAGYSGAVRIWAVGTSNSATAPRQTYQGHKREVCALAWSPDGTLIASADIEGGVHLWKADTGKRPFTYSGHGAGQPVRCLAFSPDGRLIASGGDDSTVQVWEPSSRQVLATYRDHTARVNTVTWSGDGARLASASDDGTVRVWEPSAGPVSAPPSGVGALPSNQQPGGQAPSPLAPAATTRRHLPPVADLVAGPDNGPMDLLRWIAKMLYKPDAADYNFFNSTASRAAVSFEGQGVFSFRPSPGDRSPGARYAISSLRGDAELAELARRMGAADGLPERVQGLALDYDTETV